MEHEKLFTVKGTYKDGSIPPYLIYKGEYNVTKEYAQATSDDCNARWGDRILFEVVDSDKK
jgi:hypothetical protein